MLKRNVSRFGVIEATMKVTAYNSFMTAVAVIKVQRLR